MTVTELYTSQEAYKRQCDAAKNARKTKANDGASIKWDGGYIEIKGDREEAEDFLNAVWQAAWNARTATPAVDDEVAIILAKEIEGKVYETPPLIYYRALYKLRPYLAPKQQDGGLVEKIRAAKNPDPKNVGYNQGLETAIEICQQHTAEQSVMGEGDN